MADWKEGVHVDTLRAVVHGDDKQLIGAFSWDSTPEGQDFWQQAYEGKITPAHRTILKQMLAEVEADLASKRPARKCVVVGCKEDGQPDYLVTDEFQDPDFALECAQREAAAEPGTTYAVFQLVSTTVAAVSPPVTTTA